MFPPKKTSFLSACTVWVKHVDKLMIEDLSHTAMYPELDIPEVARIAAEEFLKSGLEVDVDWVELEPW